MDVAVTLRTETAEDEDFVHRVYASTREAELALTDWSPEIKSAFTSAQFRAQRHHYRRHYPNCACELILCNGVPAGRWYVDRWEHEIRIVDIALLPAHRGAGVGEKLLRGLLAEARAAGKPVTIHVEHFNRALRLYQRLGFEAISEHGAYVLMRWKPESAA